MKGLFEKYGRYFWVLSLLISVRELYQILYGTKGDVVDFLFFVGMSYYFWGMSVGKFKGE
tara:strand:- start:304 stop:483 length:180 start_codon:yes stop_codon:yes gene_type:complete